MALALVQHKSALSDNNTPSHVAITVDSTPIDNNLLLARIFYRTSSMTNPSGWTTDIEVSTGTFITRICSKLAASEGTTYSWLMANAQTTGNGRIDEYSGAATSSYLNATGSTGGFSFPLSAVSAGSLTTTVADCVLLVLAAAVQDLAVGPAINGSYTLEESLFQTLINSGNGFHSSRIVTATGTYNPSTSWSSGPDEAGAVHAAYKAGAVAANAPTGIMPGLP